MRAPATGVSAARVTASPSASAISFANGSFVTAKRVRPNTGAASASNGGGDVSACGESQLAPPAAGAGPWSPRDASAFKGPSAGACAWLSSADCCCSFLPLLLHTACGCGATRRA